MKRLRNITKHQRMFNISVLADLEEQIGPVSMNAVFAHLMSDIQSSSDVLATCMKNGEESRARRSGHKLKGIFEQYGVRDPERRATHLAERYDLYWLNECTSLYALCQSLVDEIRKIQQARHVSNDDIDPAESRRAI